MDLIQEAWRLSARPHQRAGLPALFPTPARGPRAACRLAAAALTEDSRSPAVSTPTWSGQASGQTERRFTRLPMLIRLRGTSAPNIALPRCDYGEEVGEGGKARRLELRGGDDRTIRRGKVAGGGGGGDHGGPEPQTESAARSRVDAHVRHETRQHEVIHPGGIQLRLEVGADERVRVGLGDHRFSIFVACSPLLNQERTCFCGVPKVGSWREAEQGGGELLTEAVWKRRSLGIGASAPSGAGDRAAWPQVRMAASSGPTPKIWIIRFML